MLEMMQIDFMRQRLHGVDSSLYLLQENDEQFKALIELLDNFTVTSQRDTSTGAYVDKLTVKLDSQLKQNCFRACDAIVLRLGGVFTRYALESKRQTPQRTASFGYADVRMIANENSNIDTNGFATIPDNQNTPIVWDSLKAYIHTQTQASLEWIVNHNLGYKPSVEVIDSNGNEMIADVSHVSNNQVRVTFLTATSGIARCV